MKRICIVSTMLIWVLCTHSQKYISLTDGSYITTPDEKSYTRDVELLDDGVLVTYNLGYAKTFSDAIYPEATMLEMKGFGININAGEPAIPGRTDSFTVPDGAEVQISIEEAKYTDLPMTLSPARPLLQEESYTVYSQDNVPQIRPYRGYYPIELFEPVKTRKYRGTTIADVRFHPLQYNYDTSTVRAYYRIVYKVSFVGGSMIANMKNISPDDPFLKNTTLNHGVFKQSSPQNISSTNNVDVTKNYLIITIPEFLPAVYRLAEWKRMLGYNVIISSQSLWNADGVRAKAQYEYNNNTGGVYYLLIVGGHSLITSWRFQGGEYTDYYYGCIESEYDTSQEIYVGRLPVMTSDEANTVVDKIINYEKNPILDNNFYQTGLNCAYFQDNAHDSIEDRRFTYTTERIKNYLNSLGKTVNRVYYANPLVYPTRWNNNGYYTTGDTLPNYLRKPVFAWNGNATDIINNINAGAFYVLHRDHGETEGWVDPEFNINYFNQLNNGNKLPVVFSTNCSSGDFCDTNSRCFADSLLKMCNGGAIAVFASNRSVESSLNDLLAEAMIEAIWPSPGLLFSFGLPYSLTSTTVPFYGLAETLRYGTEKLSEFAYGSAVNFHEGYHCFGDPSMEIRTEYPTAFNNVSITRSSNSIYVDLGTDNARITFYDTNTGSVVAYQGNTATYTCNPNYTKVCIYSHNKIPYIDEPVSNPTYYIQNETVTGNITISANVIKAGSNVTNTKPTGPVTFNGGEINLNGGTVEIEGETTVILGTTLNINNQ